MKPVATSALASRALTGKEVRRRHDEPRLQEISVQRFTKLFQTVEHIGDSSRRQREKLNCAELKAGRLRLVISGMSKTVAGSSRY